MAYCNCCNTYVPESDMYDDRICNRCRSEYGGLADAFDMDEEAVQDNF